MAQLLTDYCKHCGVTGNHREYNATDYDQPHKPTRKRRVCMACRKPHWAGELLEIEKVMPKAGIQPVVEIQPVETPKRQRKPKIELTEEEKAAKRSEAAKKAAETRRRKKLEAQSEPALVG